MGGGEGDDGAADRAGGQVGAFGLAGGAADIGGVVEGDLDDSLADFGARVPVGEDGEGGFFTGDFEAILNDGLPVGILSYFAHDAAAGDIGVGQVVGGEGIGGVEIGEGERRRGGGG